MKREKKPQADQSFQISNPLFYRIAALLLLIHFGLVLHAASRMTVTHDEYWHLPVGHLNLTTGQFDYDNLNPPLLRMWAAFPLLFSQTNRVEISPETDATGHGDAFLKANNKNYHSLILYGRIMIALLSMATGVLMGYWSSKWFGNFSALITIGIWSFSPNVIAHASLVTTDLGAGFFFVFTLLTIISYSKNLKWSTTLYSGILLGLSQLAKYTCLILYPIGFLLFVILNFRKTGELKSQWKRITLQGIVLLGISLLTINMGYLFNGSFKSMKDYSFQSDSLKSLSETFSFLESFPVPFPADYIEGIDRQRAIMESQHPVYLNGEWSLKGYPQYYLMTLIYKMPHAIQGLFLLTLFLLLKNGKRNKKLQYQLLLLVPFLALFLIASKSGMQLGIRYLLPVYPFLILFIGQIGSLIDFKNNKVLTAVFLLLLIGVPLSLRNHPYHISYFNEWAGGAEGGRLHLLDSNLDWGQDLRELKDYLDQNQIDNLKLAYFGMLLPSELGIVYEHPSRRIPQPGWHAISVNYVQGRPHHIRDMEGKSHPLGLDELGYFRFFKPKKNIGTSIYLYHLSGSDVMQWQAAVRQMQQSR